MLRAALLAVIPATPDDNTIGRVGGDQRSRFLEIGDLPQLSLSWRLARPAESGFTVTTWSRMTAEAAKALYQTAPGL